MKASAIFSKIAALLLIIFGMAGLAHALPAVKIVPAFLGMSLYESIEFLLSGILIFLFETHHRKIKRTLIALFCLISLFSFIRYIIGLISGNIPNDIIPVALFLLILAGAAFILLSFREKASRNSFIAAILGLIIAASGFFSFANYPWLGSEVITASIVFTLMGAGIFSVTLEIMNLKWALKKEITIGLVLGLGLMIFMSIISHLSISTFEKNSKMVAHTREVEYHLSRLSTLLLDLEIERQNYLLTGKEVHKNSTSTHLANIFSELDLFSGLTVDNKSQQARAFELNRLFKDREFLLEKTFQRFRFEGAAANSDLLFQQSRTDLIEKITKIIQSADQEEKRLLISRQKEAELSTQRTYLIVPFGDVASLAILVWIFMILNSEVNERLQKENALRISEEKLRLSNLYNRSLLEVSLDPLVTINASGKITDVNTAFEYVTGRTRDELINSDFAGYFTEPDKVREGFRKVFRNGFVRDYYLVIKHTSGGMVDVLYNASTYTDEMGVIQGIFAAARDITELKRKEDELSRLNDSLTKSNQELAQFAYVASHDLQEPLRMVASYTQLLEKRYKDKLDEDARDFINYAVDGANRMQRLINDLLEYSRVNTRGKNLKEVDLSSVLGVAVSNLQNKINETGAMIVNDDMPCVIGDETQLMRVFQNLIENAIKFRGTEVPRIYITSRQEPNKVIVSVMDNGIGIEKKYEDRIFVIFQRLHSSSVYPGTGMGLTICKKIIERHGGKIWFNSEPGKGTTFSFSLKTGNTHV